MKIERECRKVSLYGKNVRDILIVSLPKSVHFIPQTATLTSFSAPKQEIFHFVTFGFN